MLRISKDRLKAVASSTFGFLAEWGVFLLLALAATRPLADSWTTAIPQGTEPVATVPMFNLWTMGWNISRVNAGFQDYWNAPIFHPAEHAFAFSEPQPTMALMAPVIWFGGTLAAAYNLYLWLGLSLTGVFTSRLVQRYTQSWFAAWTGGAILVMLPFVHWQSGLIQLVPLFGVVATIYALARFGEEPSVGRSLLLGTAFAVTYFLCNYYGLFLSLLLILSGGWLLGKNLWNWRTWVKLLPGAGWCLLLIGPMIYGQLQVLHDPQWNREMDYVRRQSADWGDFTATPWPQVLPLREFVSESRPGWTLSPGYLKMGLAVLGVAWGLYCPRLRRLTLFLIMFTILSVLLARGPRFHVGEWIPYEWIHNYYPGFKKTRNAFRFVALAQMGIGLLAAFGLAGLQKQPSAVFTRVGIMVVTLIGLALFGWRIVRRFLSEKWKTGFEENEAARNLETSLASPWAGLLLGVGFLAIIEVWPAPQNLHTVPDYEQQRGWMSWLEQNTAPDAALACIPFPKGGNASAYLGTTVWMYYALEHRRPLVNGYSGFFPPRFLELKKSMANFPDERSFQHLEESGAKYCVIFRGALSLQEIEQNPIARERLQWRFGDDRAEIDIYELKPQAKLAQR